MPTEKEKVTPTPFSTKPSLWERFKAICDEKRLRPNTLLNLVLEDYVNKEEK